MLESQHVFCLTAHPHASVVWSVPLYGSVLITRHADREPDPDLVHAPEVPARLHVPETRAHLESSPFHGHPSPLSHRPVGHQEHQENIHYFPNHGN